MLLNVVYVLRVSANADIWFRALKVLQVVKQII